MTLRELRKALAMIYDKYLDEEVTVDTEAATYKCHHVSITDVYFDEEGMGRPIIYLSLDDTCKEYINYDSLKNISCEDVPEDFNKAVNEEFWNILAEDKKND